MPFLTSFRYSETISGRRDSKRRAQVPEAPQLRMRVGAAQHCQCEEYGEQSGFADFQWPAPSRRLWAFTH
jgi:hypothetical protein